MKLSTKICERKGGEGGRGWEKSGEMKMSVEMCGRGGGRKAEK